MRTMKRTFMGPTTSSPVVTRLRWPPEMPRTIWLPTSVSAQTCNVPPRATITCAMRFAALPASCHTRDCKRDPTKPAACRGYVETWR